MRIQIDLTDPSYRVARSTLDSQRNALILTLANDTDSNTVELTLGADSIQDLAAFCSQARDLLAERPWESVAATF